MLWRAAGIFLLLGLLTMGVAFTPAVDSGVTTAPLALADDGAQHQDATSSSDAIRPSHTSAVTSTAVAYHLTDTGGDHSSASTSTDLHPSDTGTTASHHATHTETSTPLHTGTSTALHEETS